MYYHYYPHPVVYGYGFGFEPLLAILLIIVFLSVLGLSGIFTALAVIAFLSGHLVGAIIFGLLAYATHTRRRW